MKKPSHSRRKFERAKFRELRKLGVPAIMVAGRCEIPYGIAIGKNKVLLNSRLLFE